MGPLMCARERERASVMNCTTCSRWFFFMVTVELKNASSPAVSARNSPSTRFISITQRARRSRPPARSDANVTPSELSIVCLPECDCEASETIWGGNRVRLARAAQRKLRAGRLFGW